MKNQTLIGLAGVLTIALSGCVSTPSMDELTQLNAQDYRTTVAGNTWTSKQSWGNWAEYHPDESTGFAKAWGNWGEEHATSVYSISDDGEGCWVYSGDNEWSTPEYKYCSIMLVDQEGNYYSKTTQNNRKPERVGKVSEVVFEQGDTHGLAQ